MSTKKFGYQAHALTFLAFVGGVSVVPFLVSCFFVVRTCKKLWMKLLANRFPHLSFVETASIRTLLDTHRNQGVINVLMTLKGTCCPDVIRKCFLENLVDKRDRQGVLRFPKLRTDLVSCWGYYAWRNTSSLRIDQHIIEGSPKFRGRPLTEHNIQEYVSEIVTKYLPSNSPPWQVIIIPNMVSCEEKYCLLIRVHHLLIEEDESLNIGDFLLLKSDRDEIIRSSCQSSSNLSPCVNKNLTMSPLTNLLETPTALPNLYNRLTDNFSNRWNEFILDYDPVESPEVMKSSLGVFHCTAILLITVVAVCKEFGKYVSQNKSDIATYVAHFLTALHNEASRRNINFFILFKSGFVTFNPLTIVFKSMRYVWWIYITCALKLPILIYYEFAAFLSCINQQYCTHPNTVVAFLQNYLPLFYKAGKEIVYFVKLIYTGPINLIEELFMNNQNDTLHHLQTMSTCGRKVVAWSQPVSRKMIMEIATAAEVSETEVLLAITSNCLKEYFHHAYMDVPNVVQVAARTVSCDTILASIENSHGCVHKEAIGMVCLSLPVAMSGMRDGLTEVREIAKEVKRVREKQEALFALGGRRALLAEAFPSVLTRVALNFASRRFSVALTEVVEGPGGEAVHRESYWGDTVLTLLCWRPPQGNISISLTLQRYAGSVRLGVMADALLAPSHSAPARHWARAARRLHTMIPSLASVSH